MKLFKELSIASKFLMLLLLISNVPLFIITGGFYIFGKEKLTEQTKHTMEMQSNNVKVTINNYDSSGNCVDINTYYNYFNP